MLSAIRSAAKKMLIDFEETRRIEHAPTKGRAREAIIFEHFLRPYLPERYSIASAIIVSPGGKQSSQQDLVIYDAANAPVLLDLHSDKVLFVESILAAIEAKSSLDPRGLRAIIRKSADSWELPVAPRLTVGVVPGLHFPTMSVPIQCLGICFESTMTLSTAQRVWEETRRDVARGHALSAICILADRDGVPGLIVNVSHENLTRILPIADADSRLATIPCDSAGDALLVFYLLLVEHLHAAGAIRPGPDWQVYWRAEGFNLPAHTMTPSQQAGASAVIDGRVIIMDEVHRLRKLAEKLNIGTITDREVVEMVYLMPRMPGAEVLMDPRAVFVDENGHLVEGPSPATLCTAARAYWEETDGEIPHIVVNFIHEMFREGRRLVATTPGTDQSFGIFFGSGPSST